MSAYLWKASKYLYIKMGMNRPKIDHRSVVHLSDN